MSDETQYAVIKEMVRHLQEDVKILYKGQADNTKNVVELHVNSEQLERRLVQHNTRHENNYKDLQGEFKGLKEDFNIFKGGVFKRLDSMSGRDSVLKILFGAFAMGVIGGVVKLIFGI